MKNVLFFSRSGYAKFFPKLSSRLYQSYHAVINKEEEEIVKSHKGTVIGCFEKEFDSIIPVTIDSYYLKTSYFADRFLKNFSLQTRQLVLGKLISFWKNILIKYNIHAVVHETISYEPEEVLSLEAKKMGVKDLTFIPCPVDGYFFWKPDPYSSSFPKDLIHSVEPEPEHYKLAENQIILTKKSGHKPGYLNIKDLSYSKKRKRTILKKLLLHEIKHALNKRINANDENKALVEKFFYYNHYDQNIKGFYEKIIDDFYISNGNYDNIEHFRLYKKILFPLHMEPEATLLYFAPDFANQVYVLQEIAKRLPSDYIVIVKEHPSQPRYLLNFEFTQLRKNNPNIIYLPSEINSHSLIKSEIDAVCTITGSVGWEALVNGLPVILLGNVFYDKHPGVFKINNFNELRGCFNNLGKKITPEQHTINYLAKLLKIAYKGSYRSNYWDDKQNIANFVKSIESEMMKL